ncbi:MAG: cytochrome c [Dechloromonas sp.]|nr:MAG: cytochrome c [Dechloromonas sp.]
MKMFKLIGASAVMVAATGVTTAVAADKVDLGKREYESNCIACHGKDLKGGAYVDFLKVSPPDLTLLSKKNGGVFPLERVYAVIDGRQEVKAHGPRDMPIWGRDYQIKAGEYYVDMNYDPDAFVRGRIFALIDYLNRMQAK